MNFVPVNWRGAGARASGKWSGSSIGGIEGLKASAERAAPGIGVTLAGVGDKYKCAQANPPVDFAGGVS